MFPYVQFSCGHPNMSILPTFNTQLSTPSEHNDHNKSNTGTSNKNEVSTANNSGQHDQISFWKIVFDPGFCSDKIASHTYSGSGSPGDPYIVTWLDGDPSNPYNWSFIFKSFVILCLSITTMASALSSSAYTGAMNEIRNAFNYSTIVCSVSLMLTWSLG